MAFVSCTKTEPAGEAGLTPKSFTARVEESSTRLYVEPTGYLCWNKGDQVSVFSSGVNERYAFQGTDGDHIATFSKADQTVSGADYGRCYSVYPYNSAMSCTSDGTITAVWPGVQHYQAGGSFDREAAMLVAVTRDMTDTDLMFWNVGGYLTINLYSPVKTVVKSVTLRGNGGEALCGNCTVKAVAGQAPTISVEHSSDNSGGNNEPFGYDTGAWTRAGGTETTKIVMDCGEGVELSQNEMYPTQFVFAVPPTTFSRGITVTIVDDTGENYVKTTTKPLSVPRAFLQPMRAFSIEKPWAGPKRRIVCWGDSFTNYYVTPAIAYPEYLQPLLGNSWEVFDAGISSQRTHEIAARQGALKTYVKCSSSGITIPGSKSQKVAVSGISIDGADSMWTSDTGQPFRGGFWVSSGTNRGGLNPCTINGVKCRISAASSSATIYVSRVEDGPDVAVNNGDQIHPYGETQYRDADVFIIYMGSNGGWFKSNNNYDLLVRQHKAMVDFAQGKKYIILALHSTSTRWYPTNFDHAAYYSKMHAAFTDEGGDHVIQLKEEVNARAEELLIRTGVYESVDQISDLDRQYISEGRWPHSFMYDSPSDEHPSKYGAHAIAILVKEKMKELGYLDN
ncbi:MAG: hypothetical protein J5699_06655 [Bacteroidales bacterium]|nr:hypothetical protein [Bacteroidales bacterium]